ncbi:MAG: DUF3299 domain-containing protein [Deltaproteobacteria bacterium]|nr:DUF3299 domain-containing protein [Deltaproteobacteria bacterium]
MIFFAVILFMLPVLFPAPLPAAERQEPDYQSLSWEQLLPEAARGETLAPAELDSEKELEAYLERRGKSSVNPALQGRHVKIYGFVVPLERNEDESLTEFLLVPYYGACIHVPPPPQNQIVSVSLSRPAENIRTMDTVWVYGEMTIENVSSAAGGAAYAIRAFKLERAAVASLPQIILASALTLLCGLSVCLGWVGPFAAVRLDARRLGGVVAFGAGVMTCLGLSAASLNLSLKAAGAFLSGIGLMLFIEFVSRYRKKGATDLEKGPAGIDVALAVALHNLPECFIVFSSVMAHTGLGWALAGAMLAHNVPLGISIGLSSGRGQHPRRDFAYAVLAGAAPPLAAILAYFSLRTLFSPDMLQLLFACAGGALVFIALAELMPFALRHGRRPTALAGFASGVLLLLLVLLFSYRRYL